MKRLFHDFSNSFIPISDNINSTSLSKSDSTGGIIITKILYDHWFKNHDMFIDTLALMLPIYIIGTEDSNIYMADLRDKLEKIIRKHDSSYVWYVSFILERLCRHLSAEQLIT